MAAWRILVESTRNQLRFVLRDAEVSGPPRSLSAWLDVGEEGRLIGVEVQIEDARLVAPWNSAAGATDALSFDPASGSLYLSLGSAPGHHVRTAPTEASAATDAGGGLVSLAVPRRGPGYEIAYPSGNR